jgi:predicted enzyme related to lactoylglutathione lyase
MANNIKLIVYPAKNLEETTAFYTKFLGVEPYAAGEYYVGYKLDDLEIGLDPYGQDIISYIEVTDITASLDEYKGAGATIEQDPKDVGGGMLIAKIKDTNGNLLGLRQFPA